MAELTEKKKLKEIIKELLSSIRSGKSFSDALTMFPETFPPFYINMVKAGEAGGFSGGCPLKGSQAALNIRKTERGCAFGPHLSNTPRSCRRSSRHSASYFCRSKIHIDIFCMGQALTSTYGNSSYCKASAVKNYWWLIIAFITAGALSIRHYAVKSKAGRKLLGQIEISGCPDFRETLYRVVNCPFCKDVLARSFKAECLS